MRFSSIIIGIFLLGAIVVGSYAFLDDLANDNAYDVDYDEGYTTTFNNIRNMTEGLNESYSDLADFEANKGSAYEIITLVPDALGLILDLMVLPFNLAITLMSDIISLVGLPAWSATFIFGIIATAIVLSVVALILRYRDV